MNMLSKLSRLLPVILLLAIGPRLAAQPQQQENRFLFLIDTARAMRGYSNSIVQGMVDLMTSDMRGELRQGDTIGLWTYSDKLNTEFPMEIWSNEGKYGVMADMEGYLKSRRYEHQAHLEKVLPTLNQIIAKSQRVTIIIFFDGNGQIQGTPYDKDINSLQKKYAHQLKMAHQPFVTVLSARNGAVFDYTINYPGVIAIPHTAVAEEVVETKPPAPVAPKPVTNAPPVQRKHAPSIIMSHSTNVTQSVAPKPAPVVSATPVPTAKPTVKPAPMRSMAPVPQPIPPAAPAPEPTHAAAKMAAPPPVAPPTAQAGPAKPPAPAAATPPPKPATAPAPKNIVLTSTPETQPAAVSTPAPHPQAAVVAPAPAPQPAPVLVKVSPAPISPAPDAAPEPPATVAVAGNSPSNTATFPLLAAAFLCLTVLLLVVMLLVRRSRHTPQTSLISQSIDRPR